MKPDFYSYNPASPEDNPSLVDYFATAIRISKHRAYLHPLTSEDFAKLRLFKLRGIHAGFALKPDGDVVSVHNNSSVRGLAPTLLLQAIAQGGTKLDHFDGPLSGIFSLFFPKVTEVQRWDQQYAPENWSYKPVDILDSYYGTVKPPGYIYEDYTSGKPSVIYRSIK